VMERTNGYTGELGEFLDAKGDAEGAHGSYLE
jgi:hypothetical protein